MGKQVTYEQARTLLLERLSPLGTERVTLARCEGRVLAEDIAATESIPSFDRSAYNGYAFRSADVAGATPDAPVTLAVLEEIPAGGVPTLSVSKGTAARVMTGAPIPQGADVVVMFEKTEFTAETVTLSHAAAPGSNIVRIGEDVQQGEVFARKGMRIDPGLAGTLASLGLETPRVYRIPRIGILSTGSELIDASQQPGPGQIRNSNYYALTAALIKEGWEPVYLGTAGDDTAAIAALIESGLAVCDAILSTGGVSVGDFDLTPAAMDHAGVEMLFRGVGIKPGMACAYGVRDGKPVCALSGNPASALTNFYVLALPALRALAGDLHVVPETFSVALAGGFSKKSPVTRFLRGRLEIREGRAWVVPPKKQGNVVISSAIGCNMMAIIPAGSAPIEDGAVLEGFLL